ncbi:MAG: TusE/DsrC/DsvC family sulfur relay protein [Deltaproteobacteria bacterium]|nr:TusE/DsrC/DsvC family sulfur relay protein [Deltaproteobacteria bacterium]
MRARSRLASRPVPVDDAWTPALAEREAAALGVALGPAHWHVLGCARELRAAQGAVPSVEALARTTGLSLETIRALFHDPERDIARIGGL